jgi:predicted dehydrogenase
MAEKIRMGMVGGGPGAFIGAVHRLAAGLAGGIDLVAGAFSRNAEASRDFGAELGLAPDRAYGSYEEMLRAEAALPEADRIQCVSIVTPNDSHAPICCAAFEAGLHVICDKPLAGVLEDALTIERAAKKAGLVFALTHTYTGYPLAIEARALVEAGEIGEIRRVVVSYLQDWLSRPEDTAANKQAAWRTDPMRSGESGCFADIGVHSSNLAEFITGRRITEVAAELRTVIPCRAIDDDGAALFRLDNGAAGQIVASQVCTGGVNGLEIEVYGDKASLHWEQEEPNRLILKRRDAPEEVLKAGANMSYLSEAARSVCRTPGGHPEGYIEAFANIYAAFARAVAAFPEQPKGHPGYATIEDGVAGMRFVRASRLSSENKSAWTALGGVENQS